MGCSPGAPSGWLTPAKPAIASSAVVAIHQRSTVAIPGSAGKLKLTIDDITRGQVIASIATDTGNAILAPVSMREGDSAQFAADGRDYLLILAELDNRLIGVDTGVFYIRAAGGAAPGRSATIERLIDTIRSQHGAVFIRNGVEYEAADAADHIKSKWRRLEKWIETPEDFINVAASASSASGEPYRIRFPDGREMKLADFLLRELAAINSK